MTSYSNDMVACHVLSWLAPEMTLLPNPAEKVDGGRVCRRATLVDPEGGACERSLSLHALYSCRQPAVLGSGSLEPGGTT